MSEAEKIAARLAAWVQDEPNRIAAYFDVDADAKEVIRNGVKKSRPASVDADLQAVRKVLEAEKEQG